MADSPTPDSLTDFESGAELCRDQDRVTVHATWRARALPVRLTVFSQEISRLPSFRRAFKMDRGMLETLRHQSVVRYLGDGETDGRLFYWTEDCEAGSLQAALQGVRPLLVEDLIEIGWQVCSALQQAHNLGLSHGGLTADTILLSEDLQVSLVDFGVQRWLRAAAGDRAAGLATTAASAETAGGVTAAAGAGTDSGPGKSLWRLEVERDLKDLATVLLQPLQQMRAEATVSGGPRPAGSGALTRLLERMLQLGESSQPVSARDMQGRLGELLIGNDADEMQLLDQREQAGKSRRSIVDELFDSPASDSGRQNPPAGTSSAETRRQLPILPILVVLLLCVIVLLLAGLLR